MLAVVETDAEGLMASLVLFDVDAMVPALDELEIRYARSGKLGAVERQVVLGFVAVNHRAWNELDAVLAPDVSVVDHRRLGFPAGVGKEPLIHELQSLVEQVPDVVVIIERLAGAGHAVLAENHQVGTSTDGLVVDWQWYLVFSLNRDGLLELMEYFDENDGGAAARAPGSRSSPVATPDGADTRRGGMRGCRGAGARDEVRPVGRRDAARLPAVGRRSAAADRPGAPVQRRGRVGARALPAGARVHRSAHDLRAVRQAGIGLSDRPDELPTLEQRIGDIVAVMDAVGWERAHLLGMSEGGIMSQLFAAEYPERVDHLLLIGTGVPPRYWDRIGGYVRPGDAPVLPVDELFGELRPAGRGLARERRVLRRVVHAEPRPTTSRTSAGSAGCSGSRRAPRTSPTRSRAS